MTRKDEWHQLGVDARVTSGGPRVGVLLWEDAQDPGSISGMPWSMRSALGRAGCEVVGVPAGPRGDAPVVSGDVAVVGLPVGLRKTMADHASSSRVRRREERLAVAAARQVSTAIARLGLDAIFSPCMSRPLAYLGHGTPVVYASDATASLLIETYAGFHDRESEWREAVISLETRAFARADRIAVASDRTARSAIVDHSAAADRVSIVPLGANVVPHPEDDCRPLGLPSPRDLRLLLCAADPERKQLGLCVEVVGELRRRGWHATLHYIGPERPECRRPEVEWAGRLELGNPEHAAIHRGLLRDCHLAILPSLAEMYGIAPIESAAFGRPAVVSDAGGLPTVVRDGETGRVVPLGTPVEGWADAVESVCARADRYLRLGEAAQARFERELNWDAWGRSVRGLVEEAIAVAA